MPQGMQFFGKGKLAWAQRFRDAEKQIEFPKAAQQQVRGQFNLGGPLNPWSQLHPFSRFHLPTLLSWGLEQSSICDHQ